MKDGNRITPEDGKKKAGWLRRLLDWMARGAQKAVKSGKYCPT